MKLKHAVKAMIWRSGEHGKQFLLLQLNAAEAAEKPLGDEWHPSGGAKDDLNEPDHDALLREVFEETAIKPDELVVETAPYFKAEWDAPYIGVPGFHFVANFYACEFVGKDRKFTLSREHDDAAWFYPNELPASTPEGARVAIAELMKRK